MAIYNCLSVSKTGKFRVLPQFGPGGETYHKCNTRTINHTVDNSCTDVFCHLGQDSCSSLPEVQAKMKDNIYSTIRRRIHPTGTDPPMAQPHCFQGSIEEDIADYILEELIEQPKNYFNCLNSFVAATEASMRFSAVLPSPAAANPSPAAITTATATTSPTSPTSPASRIRN